MYLPWMAKDFGFYETTPLERSRPRLAATVYCKMDIPYREPQVEAEETVVAVLEFTDKCVFVKFDGTWELRDRV